MQHLSHTPVMFNDVRILESSWNYRVKLKETVTLAVHSLIGKKIYLFF